MKQQYQIVHKKVLTPEISQISVHAPLVAAKAKAGQFIILRVDADGERIPLTISSADTENGTITVIFQKVGATTMALDQLQEGDCLHDFVGPLGEPTHVEGYGRVAVLGGGLGCAIALPVAKALHEAGNQVDLIGGFKTKDIVILEEEMGQACTDLHICTDDGTYGYHGFVTGKLEELIQSGVKFRPRVRHRPPDDDEVCLQADQAVRDPHHGQHEPHYDRRHRHVRRLPPERGRRDEVRLRGRPRLRRPPGGLRRGDRPERYVQRF